MQFAWLVLVLWQTGIVGSRAIHQHALLSSTREQESHLMDIDDTPAPDHVMVQRRSNPHGEILPEYMSTQRPYFVDPAMHIHKSAERDFQSTIFTKYWACILDKVSDQAVNVDVFLLDIVGLTYTV